MPHTYEPKIGKLCLLESTGQQNLQALLQYLEERVIDTGFYEFNEYWHDFIHNYLNDDNVNRLTTFLGKSISDITPGDYDRLPIQSKRIFTDHVEEQGGFRYARYNDPINCPSWFYLRPLDGRVLPANTWLVHFTDHQDEIVRNGFSFGAPDMTRLGLTIVANIFGGMSRSDTREQGYNFGYTLDEDINARAEMAKAGRFYGRNAVLFQAACLRVHHNGDNENQAIFWGEDVSVSKIIPLMHTGAGWKSVNNVEKESILDLINLIISGSDNSTKNGDTHEAR